MGVETDPANAAGAGAILVVVPCRNASMWIEDLLDSLLAQERLPDHVAVVDDGSTDGSADVAARWVDRNGAEAWVKVLRQPPRGVSTAVHVGLATSRSEFVCRIDADDMIAPEYLARLESTLAEHPAAAYAYTAMEMFGARVGPWPYTRDFDPTSLIIEGNFVSVGALVRRTAFEAAGGFADLPAWEDWDLWLRLLERGFVGVFVDDPLYMWRRHGSSRNTLSWRRRRALRLRIWWRHRGLLARHVLRSAPYIAHRLRHPARQQ